MYDKNHYDQEMLEHGLSHTKNQRDLVEIWVNMSVAMTLTGHRIYGLKLGGYTGSWNREYYMTSILSS